jgi:rSAM/selenodomain-associated transferase 1
MTKAPIAGRVKTRLTPPLTSEEAAELNKCFLQDIAAAIIRAGTETRGVGCYEPVGAEEIYQQILPSSFALLPQREATFGERLRGAAEDLFSAGFASVCLIGSDSPTVPLSSYARAALRLAEPGESVVLGPSEDGGYYLIGMKKVYPRLFEDITWSTDRVFEQTLARAAELQLPVHLLPAALDVDDQATLRRLYDQLLVSDETEQSQSAPATRAFLQDLIRREGRDRIWGISSPSAS